MGAVFEPFLNSGFNFTILHSDGNIEYFKDELQIWEMRLAKSFPDRLSRPATLFSSKSLINFNTVSSDKIKFEFRVR